jgi:hypothetical protein
VDIGTSINKSVTRRRVFPARFFLAYLDQLHLTPALLARGQIQGLPIPVQEVSVHAWGLRTRRALISLAITVYEVLPSAYFKSIGTRV